MFSTLVSVALFASVAFQGVVADFAVNTPTLTQCQASTVSWEPTKGPYTVLLVPAADGCAEALQDAGDFDTTTTQLTPNLPAGTQVIISVTDANNQETWSNPITIQPSNDSSCLSSASTSSSATPANVAGNVAGGTSTSTSTSAKSSSSSGVEAIGGVANAGLGLSSAGVSARQATGPVALLAGVVAIFALL